jgi:hypothetical protein
MKNLLKFTKETVNVGKKSKNAINSDGKLSRVIAFELAPS